MQTEPYEKTRSESRMPSAPEKALLPLFDSPTTFRNVFERVDWFNFTSFILLPLIAIYGVFTTKFNLKTVIFGYIYSQLSGFGITAGYHRYWSHRAYQATIPLQLILLYFGASASQGSVYWWCKRHRAHHRWTDTERDPYNAKRGFFYSHIGWVLLKQQRSIDYIDISDLKNDRLVAFQHKYFIIISLFTSVVVPVAVCKIFWDDVWGGIYFAAALRIFLVHHITFSINSVSHMFGENAYDDHLTPRDHWLTAFITLGEGYHNFHHQFPQDYRNAILYYQYDPTKWLIKILEFFGLAYNLKTFPENEISKGRLQMLEIKLEKEKKSIAYGTPINQLPVYTWNEYQHLVNDCNKPWILIEGILYDLEGFDHPGGIKYITAGYGKDMTTSFNGGVYNHSNGARNLLSMMRVGVLLNGMEVMDDISREEEVNSLALDSYSKLR
ncbi:stearoyl-CoA desaturase [Spinellus fusiger]|nr:stearoyl-CoA desaturase [Spinellus fusiger]